MVLNKRNGNSGHFCQICVEVEEMMCVPGLRYLPGINHIARNIGCDCPAVKLTVDLRHGCSR